MLAGQFLQQLGVGYGDYTQERHQWLAQLTMDESNRDMPSTLALD
jgi:hypothetical protein